MNGAASCKNIKSITMGGQRGICERAKDCDSEELATGFGVRGMSRNGVEYIVHASAWGLGVALLETDLIHPRREVAGVWRGEKRDKRAFAGGKQPKNPHF